MGLVLAQLTPLPLFLVGLGLGTTAVAIASVAGGVLMALVVGLAVAVPFFAVYALPSLIVVRQALLSRATPDGALEWYPSGPLLAVLAVYGAAGFVTAEFLLLAEIEEIRTFVGTTMSELMLASDPGLTDEERAHRVTDLLTMLPVAVLLWWLLLMVVNGTLGQAILSRSQRNLRPSPHYLMIRVPLTLAVAGGVSLLAWIAGGETISGIGRVVTIMLAMPFFLQGAAVVHVVSRPWPGRGFVLGVFYIAVLLLPGWLGLVLVALLGLAEHWAGLRWRFAGDAPGEEDI